MQASSGRDGYVSSFGLNFCVGACMFGGEVALSTCEKLLSRSLIDVNRS